jgi:hypothetical protein
MTRQGRYNLDPTRKGFGYGVNGAMTRFVRVPARILHHVPDSLPMEQACLTEPCCVAYNAVVRNARIEPGDRVIVLGPGTIGILCAAMARLCGAQVAVVAAGKDLEIVAGMSEERKKIIRSEREKLSREGFKAKAFAKAAAGYAARKMAEVTREIARRQLHQVRHRKEEQRRKAASKIQAFFRGHRVRFTLKQLMERRALQEPLTLAFYLGVSLPLAATWWIATGTGAMLGRALGDPSAIGLDFAFSAMFIAIAVFPLLGRAARMINSEL